MRERIYRNLDQKVLFFGLTYPQLGILCALSVGASELFKRLEIARGWGSLLVLLAILFFRWANKKWGTLTLARWLRFSFLPDEIPNQIARVTNRRPDRLHII
jgi:hypothetical protein